MNKVLKIAVAILIANIIIVICMRTIPFQEIFYNIYYKEKYNSREIVQAVSNYNLADGSFSESSIEKNGFIAKISNIDYDKENENILNLQFDFSTTDNTGLNTVGFLLRIYDEVNENVICYQIYGDKGLDDMEYIFYNRYFNNGDGWRMNSYAEISNERDKDNITRNLKIKLPDDFVIKGKYNIDLFNLQYQTTKSPDYYKVIEPLGEFKFIINFE